MKHGYLSEYFPKIATKKLTSVEINPNTSHQHEFNGNKELKEIFGIESRTFEATFLYLNDFDEDGVTGTWSLTWYDARAKSADRTWRSEYRLYFTDNEVLNCASENDLLIIGLRPDWSLLVVIAESESSISNQLKWLFWISDKNELSFSVISELETEQNRVWFASRIILETIGIEVETEDNTFLSDMLSKFWEKSFPDTKTFSSYARETLWEEIIGLDNDTLLMLCLDREEVLFRTFEKYFLADRLSQGFISAGKPDVEGFISFSLHIQNRRKSRAWAWFENHLEYLFFKENIKFDRTKVTENKSKPDFLFPWISEYKDMTFPVDKLIVLWAKTSCKDRWRQILSEADRIPQKHLITLQTGISIAQTNEMIEKNVQLILPKQLHQTYTIEQQKILMDVSGFINLVKTKQ